MQFSNICVLCLALASCGLGTAEESEAIVDEALSASLSVTSVTASSDDGNVPSNVLDGSYATRWSALGKGSWLTADLGGSQTISAVQVGWYLGASRASTFALSASIDGQTFAPLFSGASSGRSTRVETYSVPATRARYVKLTVMGNTQNDWASVTELRIILGSAAVDAGTPTGPGTPDAGSAGPTGSAYERAVLADRPVALWAMSGASSGHESDLSGNGNTGTYRGTPGAAALPNGGPASDFDGVSEYLTVPSRATFSVPTTGRLTFEAWIRPEVLQFPNDTSDGYVHYLGKCASFSPTCEWSARMYSLSNAESRPSRLSAYAFNTSAGLGAGAFWQPATGVIAAGAWIHVVGEYQMVTQPAGCSGPQLGGIDIWVNGVRWNVASHAPTGCMSQYSIVPTASTSPLNIGTVALDSWFKGAIGEVAIYDYLLTPAQISAHFTQMTGRSPAGSCGGSTCSL